MTPLEGQTALVTGAGRGLGACIARRLAGDGADVVLLGRQADALDEQRRLIESDGGKAGIAVADLSDLDAIPALAEKVGPVGILVNNAASPEEWCPILQRDGRALGPRAQD